MYTHSVSFRPPLSILLICVLLSSGCANMKQIVRDTNGVLMSVMMATELEETGEDDRLEVFQERIIRSCEPMLASARLRIEGENIPLVTLLDFLFSYDDCRKTIDATQLELAALDRTK